MNEENIDKILDRLENKLIVIIQNEIRIAKEKLKWKLG